MEHGKLVLRRFLLPITRGIVHANAFGAVDGAAGCFFVEFGGLLQEAVLHVLHWVHRARAAMACAISARAKMRITLPFMR